MMIEEMPRTDCFAFLTRKGFGRLACSKDKQPYVTPILFACHSEALYMFTTVGRKVMWMRSNPLVCVQADEVESAQNWSSVVAFGRFEELTATPGLAHAREFAFTLLQNRAQWWEPAYVKTIVGGQERPLDIVYFRVHVSEISGHHTVA